MVTQPIKARAIEKYDKEEAKALLSFLEWGIDEYNTPFVKATNSDGGYFFEYEEVPCATKYNEETDEAEYKEGYHNYFCIRFVRYSNKNKWYHLTKCKTGVIIQLQTNTT